MANPIDKFYFLNQNSRIKSYPPEIIEQIFTDYYGGVSISEIREKYPKFKSTGIHRQLPYTKTDELCEKCNNRIYSNKEKIGNKSFKTHKLCISCGHNYEYDCSCKICADERKKEEAQKLIEAQEIWNEYYIENYNFNYTIDNISIYDEVYLQLIINNFSKNDYQYLNFKKLNKKPHPILYINIQTLINRKIIILNVSNFINPYRYFPEEDDFLTDKELNWVLNIKNNEGELISLVDFLNYMKNKIYTKEEKELLWKEVYQQELNSYITNQFELYLRLRCIDSMIVNYTTELLINEYPLSKAFAIVYSAVNSTIRYKQNYPTTETKIISFFRNKITDLANRKEMKTIKDFNRPVFIQNTLFNDFVLQEILKVQHVYFYLHTDKVLNNSNYKKREDIYGNII